MKLKYWVRFRVSWFPRRRKHAFGKQILHASRYRITSIEKFPRSTEITFDEFILEFPSLFVYRSRRERGIGCTQSHPIARAAYTDRKTGHGCLQPMIRGITRKNGVSALLVLTTIHGALSLRQFGSVLRIAVALSTIFSAHAMSTRPSVQTLSSKKIIETFETSFPPERKCVLRRS